MAELGVSITEISIILFKQKFSFHEKSRHWAYRLLTVRARVQPFRTGIASLNINFKRTYPFKNAIRATTLKDYRDRTKNSCPQLPFALG